MYIVLFDNMAVELFVTLLAARHRVAKLKERNIFCEIRKLGELVE